jgi:hypothetical protein
MTAAGHSTSIMPETKQKKRSGAALWLAVGLAVGTLALGGFAAARAWQSATNAMRQYDVRTVLEWARLAPLPPSAAGVRTEAVTNMFSGSVYLQFTASPAEVQDWLKASPGIREAETEGQAPDSRGSDPAWFTPPKGSRWYRIPQDHDANYGEVQVDETTGTVYVKASHS